MVFEKELATGPFCKKKVQLGTQTEKFNLGVVFVVFFLIF
jgi:hypothetical protein